MEKEQQNEAQAALSMKAWAKSAGIGLSTIYTLPEDLQPKSTKIGRRRLIIETAHDWILRVAKAGGAETTRMKGAA